MIVRNSEGKFVKGSGGFRGRHTEDSKQKMRLAHLGTKKHTQEFKNRRSLEMLGNTQGFQKGVMFEEENVNWKGDKVGYRCLHLWVYRRLGRPTKCEFCGKDGLTGKQIQWANKSHQYKRELDDWIRLCTPCHKNYDNQGRRVTL